MCSYGVPPSLAFTRFCLWPLCGPCVAPVWPLCGPCVAPVGCLEIRKFSLHNPFAAGGRAKWAPTGK